MTPIHKHLRCHKEYNVKAKEKIIRFIMMNMFPGHGEKSFNYHESERDGERDWVKRRGRERKN